MSSRFDQVCDVVQSMSLSLSSQECPNDLRRDFSMAVLADSYQFQVEDLQRQLDRTQKDLAHFHFIVNDLQAEVDLQQMRSDCVLDYLQASADVPHRSHPDTGAETFDIASHASSGD